MLMNPFFLHKTSFKYGRFVSFDYSTPCYNGVLLSSDKVKDTGHYVFFICKQFKNFFILSFNKVYSGF